MGTGTVHQTDCRGRRFSRAVLNSGQWDIHSVYHIGLKKSTILGSEGSHWVLVWWGVGGVGQITKFQADSYVPKYLVVDLTGLPKDLTQTAQRRTYSKCRTLTNEALHAGKTRVCNIWYYRTSIQLRLE